tara:strand:- start:772 stop:2487 length:1716 start_codon:yes stop_codon:yes gene_type:complete
MDIVLGIDFGTCNSIASFWDGDKINYIKNNNNTNFFPSNINFTKNDIVLCCNNDYNNIKNIKLLIGQNIEKINLNNNVSGKQLFIKNNKLCFYNKFDNIYYSLEKLNSLILNKIINNAEIQLQCKINKIILSVPAHFNSNQRKSILESINLSNLNCLRIINEPTAASIAYNLQFHNDKNILVFDLGAGTMDISIINIDDGLFEILNTYGNNNIGGELFTNIIYNHILKLLKNNDVLDEFIQTNEHNIKNACENLKINLTQHNTFNFDNYTFNFTIEQINNLFKNTIQNIINQIKFTINEIDLQINDIDHILLVGGSSKLQIINSEITKLFNKSVISTVNPYYVVSYGLSKYGFLLNNPDNKINNEITLLDIVPLSIGIESNSGLMVKLIEKGDKIPVTKYEYFKVDLDSDKSIDINIYQGERCFVKDNYLIHNIKLNNINTLVVKIEIKIDVNSVIYIKISDKQTDLKIIKINNEIAKDKITQNIKESILSDDKIKKNTIILLNTLKKYIKFLKEQINKLDISLKEKNILKNNIKDYVKDYEIFTKDTNYNKIKNYIIHIEKKYNFIKFLG